MPKFIINNYIQGNTSPLAHRDIVDEIIKVDVCSHSLEGNTSTTVIDVSDTIFNLIKQGIENGTII